MHSLLKFTNNIPTAGYATSDELNHLTGRLHDTIVGPTGRSDQSDRPVGQTVAEPPTSVSQINASWLATT